MVLEKIFEGFLLLYGHGVHFGHVTSIMLINLISMYQKKTYIQNLVKNSPVVSEKGKFIFSKVNDLRPKVKK